MTDGIAVTGTQNSPGLAVTQSSRIAVKNFNLQQASANAVAAIQLTAVTDSFLTYVGTGGNPSAGISLGAATTGVLVRNTIAAIGGLVNRGSRCGHRLL